MPTINIIPYQVYSESAKQLREVLRNIGWSANRYNTDSYTEGWFAGHNKLFVNWGWSGFPLGVGQRDVYRHTRNHHFLNPAIVPFTNKLNFFRLFEGEGWLPPFWTTLSSAQHAVENGATVVARARLAGHSGEGISVHSLHNNPQLPQAALYVKYIKKAEEYRVHFFKGSSRLIVQQKRLRTDTERHDGTFLVRNVHNGWIYSREHLNVPECVYRVAELFKENLSNTLDFGAIDIIYNRQYDRAYILEVNTSPGLAGTTIEDYRKAMQFFYAVKVEGVQPSAAESQYGLVPF